MYKEPISLDEISDEIKAVWDVRSTDQRCIESYYNLAAAIIASAAKHRDKSFFESDWFRMLIQDDDIDGMTLYNQILENFDKYNNAFVPDKISKEFKGGYYDI